MTSKSKSEKEICITKGEKIICPFCGGHCKFSYYMANYAIYKCDCCGTAQSHPKPSLKDLISFYEGFLFKGEIKNKALVYKSAELLFGGLKIPANGNMRMLDVGGGSGFYAKAFEDMGYGESFYIDIDPQACEFAAELGVRNIINADVIGYDFHVSYDFIMCRHLVEHLTDPNSFILKLIELLSPTGQLLLICPNGESLEYLAYPKYLLKRLLKVYKSNRWGFYYVLKVLFGGHFNHGIDPIRHLWAISPKGLGIFLGEHNKRFDIDTHALTDIAFSPYYSPMSFLDRIFSFLGDNITAPIKGSTHLSAIIRK